MYKFYFDYLSPFSYFAWTRLPDIELTFCPVSLGALLNHWEIKGPGEVKPKREFLLRSAIRYARLHNIPFTTPLEHPFNSLYALRMSTLFAAQEKQKEVISCIWKAGFISRLDLGKPEVLIKALDQDKLDGEGIYERSFERNAKLEVKNNIKEAITYGAFGVPSFIVNNELFWGNDSIDDLVRFTQDKDLLDRGLYTELLKTTNRGAAQSIP